MVKDNPLNIENIKQLQGDDEKLINQAAKYKDRYIKKRVGIVDNIPWYVKPGDAEANWKIALPQNLLMPTIRWFHQVTGHPGSKCLYMQIYLRYYHIDLRGKVDKFCCKYCQQNKLPGKGHGLLPEQELCSIPFEECAVDLIGPWKIQVRKKAFTFNALTVIDTVSNLVELIRIKKKSSENVAKKYAQAWLTRYPWPERCVLDNGGEFVGPEFQLLLQNCQMKDAPTTSRNPTANAICERMHQTVGNVLQTFIHSSPPVLTLKKAEDFVDEALSIAMHAMWANFHTTIGSSPGALVFNRDMFLNLPLIADWHAITMKQKHLVNHNLIRENKKRKQYDYIQGQKVLKKKHKPQKLEEKTRGPYPILQTHVNGTLTIELKPKVSERINIRRVIPANLGMVEDLSRGYRNANFDAR